MKRVKAVAAILTLLLVGAGLGAGGAFSVLYKQTGKELVRRFERAADRFRGTQETMKVGEGWVGRSPVAIAVEADSTGWDNPTVIAFPPKPPQSNGDVLYYVAEMGGRIGYKTLGGEIGTLVEGLLNFDRQPMDEVGLLGLAFDKSAPVAYVSMTYWNDDIGSYFNKVERLDLAEDGKTTTGRSAVLDMADDPTVPSYNSHFVSIGPDDMLYVGIGSGVDKIDALNLDKFAGKVIRLTKDGAAPSDNPFFDPAKPASARSYLFAYGLRNPIDLAWDPKTGVAVVSDVGPGIDRILRLEKGVNYTFGDSNDQMRANALYTWGPNESIGGGSAPVGVTITSGDALTDKPSLYVGLFGSVHVPGPNTGKRVLRFDFDPRGYLAGSSTNLAVYEGPEFSSVVDVEAAPDGTIYFTDLWGESSQPHTKGGVIYRIVPAKPTPTTTATVN